MEPVLDLASTATLLLNYVIPFSVASVSAYLEKRERNTSGKD